MSSVSAQVYVNDKQHGWLPADVISNDGKSANVRVHLPKDGEPGIHEGKSSERIVKLKDYEDGILPLQNVDESGNFMEVEDMVDLPYLHEAAILYNLKERHRKVLPYTRVGDIVIAVNPFQWNLGLYGEDTQELYADKLIWNPAMEGDSKTAVRPHVYESSSLAYRGLAVDNRHQSILVSGESGAGKTETVKIVMSHLASVQSSDLHASDEASFQSKVVRKVLDSNPLLEAFGNAKTVRNDNSSRFGKYIQLQFDVEDATTAAFSGRALPSCMLVGSSSETYLLEKSRVVGHESTERTYHIFYQILAAPKEEKIAIWKELGDMENSSFNYVGDTDTLLIEGKTDGKNWEGTVSALKLIGVEGEKLMMLMRAVCVILQLGNLTFAEDPSNDDGSIISSTEELSKLAELMGVDCAVIQKALTFRTIIAGKEVYSVPMKESDSTDVRDAFAKEIYQTAFDWLVNAINEATAAEYNYPNADDVDEFGLIGLLDIFGFESFKVNRFEQLCINYANEKLQQKYTLDVFRAVQEEYEFEGIELGDVAFSDNSEVLNLLEGRMGVVAVLNEECVRPKGNDLTFVSKLKTVNAELACLIPNPLDRPNEFAIEHYAGPVKYDATQFVKKNMDAVPKDLLDCAEQSSNTILSVEMKAAVDAKKPEAKAARGKKAAPVTVGSKFRNQLQSLMHSIAKTKTRYIRCIKPNPEKVPLKMNLESSCQQLRCAGVVAAVTISRVAFPNRLMHDTAIDRFRCLSSKNTMHDVDEKKDDEALSGPRAAVEILLDELLKDMEIKEDDGSIKKVHVCGKSRVYFRTGALEFLEQERFHALGVFAIKIQRIVRGFVATSKFRTLVYQTISAQAMARRTITRKAFLKMKYSAIVLECFQRTVVAKAELLRLTKEKASKLFQSAYRMLRAVVHFKKNRNATIIVQKYARGAIQRPIYKQMKKEAAEEIRVNSKLAALQKRLNDAEMKWIQADKARLEAEKKAVSGGGEVVVVEGAGEPKRMTEQQQTLFDESRKMLEYLRKEVFKLKATNYLINSDLTKTKRSYHQLTDHYSSLTSSFEALRQHANQLSTANKKFMLDTTVQKVKMSTMKQDVNSSEKSLKKEVIYLKEELKRKESAHNIEMAKLKKEINKLKANQSSGVASPEKKSTKSPTSSSTTSSSTKNGNNRKQRRSVRVEDDYDWGHDRYDEMEKSGEGKKVQTKGRSSNSVGGRSSNSVGGRSSNSVSSKDSSSIKKNTKRTQQEKDPRGRAQNKGRGQNPSSSQGQKQTTSSQKQTTSSQKQTTSSQKQTTSSQKQRTSSQKQTTSGQKQNSSSRGQTASPSSRKNQPKSNQSQKPKQAQTPSTSPPPPSKKMSSLASALASTKKK